MIGLVVERDPVLEGLTIKSITPGSVADRSGHFRVGDLLKAVNNQPVGRTTSLSATALTASTPGTLLAIVFHRGSNEHLVYLRTPNDNARKGAGGGNHSNNNLSHNDLSFANSSHTTAISRRAASSIASFPSSADVKPISWSGLSNAVAIGNDTLRFAEEEQDDQQQHDQLLSELDIYERFRKKTAASSNTSAGSSRGGLGRASPHLRSRAGSAAAGVVVNNAIAPAEESHPFGEGEEIITTTEEESYILAPPPANGYQYCPTPSPSPMEGAKRPVPQAGSDKNNKEEEDEQEKAKGNDNNNEEEEPEKRNSNEDDEQPSELPISQQRSHRSTPGGSRALLRSSPSSRGSGGSRKAVGVYTTASLLGEGLEEFDFDETDEHDDLRLSRGSLRSWANLTSPPLQTVAEEPLNGRGRRVSRPSRSQSVPLTEKKHEEEEETESPARRGFRKSPKKTIPPPMSPIVVTPSRIIPEKASAVERMTQGLPSGLDGTGQNHKDADTLRRYHEQVRSRAIAYKNQIVTMGKESAIVRVEDPFDFLDQHVSRQQKAQERQSQQVKKALSNIGLQPRPRGLSYSQTLLALRSQQQQDEGTQFGGWDETFLAESINLNDGSDHSHAKSATLRNSFDATMNSSGRWPAEESLLLSASMSAQGAIDAMSAAAPGSVEGGNRKLFPFDYDQSTVDDGFDGGSEYEINFSREDGVSNNPVFDFSYENFKKNLMNNKPEGDDEHAGQQGAFPENEQEETSIQTSQTLTTDKPVVLQKNEQTGTDDIADILKEEEEEQQEKPEDKVQAEEEKEQRKEEGMRRRSVDSFMQTTEHNNDKGKRGGGTPLSQSRERPMSRDSSSRASSSRPGSSDDRYRNFSPYSASFDVSMRQNRQHRISHEASSSMDDSTMAVQTMALNYSRQPATVEIMANFDDLQRERVAKELWRREKHEMSLMRKHVLIAERDEAHKKQLESSMIAKATGSTFGQSPGGKLTNFSKIESFIAQTARRAAESPGPGAYDVNDLKSKKTGGVLSTSNAKSVVEMAIIKSVESPGPGAYEHVDLMYKPQGVTFAASSSHAYLRDEIERAKAIPAPDAYMPERSYEKLTKRIVGGKVNKSNEPNYFEKIIRDKARNVPAPATYAEEEVEPDRRRSPSPNPPMSDDPLPSESMIEGLDFSSNSSSNMAMSKKKQQQGNTSHRNSHKIRTRPFILDEAKGGVIGRDRRNYSYLNSEQLATPGVGEYNTGSAADALLEKRDTANVTLRNPLVATSPDKKIGDKSGGVGGPGYYDSRPKEKIKGGKIGDLVTPSQIDTIIRRSRQIPGPGQYIQPQQQQQQQQSSSTDSSTHHTRFPVAPITHCATALAQSAFSQQQPPPSSKSKIRIGHEVNPNNGRHASTPGPGHYDTVRSSLPARGFATSREGGGWLQKAMKRAAESPGPGEYTAAEADSAHAIRTRVTMADKLHVSYRPTSANTVSQATRDKFSRLRPGQTFDAPDAGKGNARDKIFPRFLEERSRKLNTSSRKDFDEFNSGVGTRDWPAALVNSISL